MSQKKTKKYALSLIIIASLILVIAIPLILPNTKTVIPSLLNTNTNTLPPSSTTAKSNPQPVDLWWNYSWGFRREINVTELNYVDRVNDTAIVNLTFDNGHCANNSIRVLYYNQTTSSWVEVPSQVENVTYYPGGSYIENCRLVFLVNVTKGGTSTYYVYYNDTYSGLPKTYSTPLSINPSGDTFTFYTGVISGYYQAYYPNPSPVDYDASFRQFIINGVNLIPSSGTHAGIDRIDADDNGRFNLGNQLNWVIHVVESGPVRVVVRVNKTSTDKFASAGGGGSYGPMNKTYVFYAYQGVVSVNIECNDGWVPIYDFATVITSSQWEFYIDSYNPPGTAYDLKWTDGKYGIQPQNYLALVRNDGLGFGLLGSPEWPEDLSGGTSMEFGTGIDGSVSSFGIRNDARDGQSAISMPFHYYIVGVTGGYDEIVDAWNRVNNPVNSSVGSEVRIFYPLTVNVTDSFGNPIPNANVTVYNQPGPTSYNTSGTTNSQGLCNFLIYENYTSDQYWIQAHVDTSYKNYSSQAFRWNPAENFTGSPYTLNISMNITSIYVEVRDRGLDSRVQNANVTLNYTEPSLEDISQLVNEFYANCSFYAWANKNLTINVYTSENESIHQFYNYDTMEEILMPLNMTGPERVLVEIARNIDSHQTILTCVNGTTLSAYWSDNVTFCVWFNLSLDGQPKNKAVKANWMNYTIYYGGSMVASGTMEEVATGYHRANFNTSLAGLRGGVSYTITISAEPSSTADYLYPTPISIFLTLEKIPVNITTSPSVVNTTWNETVSFGIWAYLYDTPHGKPVVDASVNYTIRGTSYINQNMEVVAPGNYSVPQSVLGNLVPGEYQVNIVAFKGNYSIPNVSISLIINSVNTTLLAALDKVQGFYDQNITISVTFMTDDGAPVHNASVGWIIENTNITGAMVEVGGTGNYTGTIPAEAISAGTHQLIISAGKANYTTRYKFLILEVKGTQTTLAPTAFAMLPVDSPAYLMLGPFIQVENSLPVVPIIFTYVDHNGNPVPNATVTVTGGLPVISIGKGAVKLSALQPVALGASGTYLILVPTFGLPPSSFMITIQAQAANYQLQQTQILLSIKERAVPIPFTSIRIPLTMFLITLAAVAIPTAAFGAYTYIKRARIPYIIKRIDELIKAISRGEKVEVKLIPREKVIGDLLREELAIVGVEPRVERYVPVELADMIIPLLVESGMEEKEANALALELRTATPAERERLLESVGVPGELSAKIIQTIEEYEEKREFIGKPSRESAEEMEETEEQAEEGEEEEKTEDISNEEGESLEESEKD